MTFCWGDEVSDAGSAAAAARLLGSQYFEGAGWVTLGEDHGASYTRLDRGECRVGNASASEQFSEHEVFDVPDNPPTNEGPRFSRIHRFGLPEGLSTTINEELTRTWLQRMNLEESSTVSNTNNGFHSHEEAWVDGLSAWYSRLMPLVKAAVSDSACSGNTPQITGWINLSSPISFNCLHDHGDSQLSLVYFVRAGNAEQAPDHEQLQAGSLLLRPQMVAFSHEYGIFDVPPRAGEMWVFPGHLAHAVLPRYLSKEVDVDNDMRISVACNVSIN